MNLVKEMTSNNNRCVNISLNSLGIFSNECSMFLEMISDIGFDKKQHYRVIKKMINQANLEC